MPDIRCPKCGTVFRVDESDYAAILSQVRSSEFETELARRQAEIEKHHAVKEQMLKVEAQRSYEHDMAKKENEKNELRHEIERLKGIISGFEAEKKAELISVNADGERRMAELRRLKDEELRDRERDLIVLKAKIDSDRMAAENREHELRERHQAQLRDKQEEIDRLKDFKTRLSTKMVGESLEIHCSTLFAGAQSMGLFPNAYFEKDNDIRTGSKGDFIFRDYDGGEEYISIMFEMKNEMDATATKHRNADFLEKLDRDRREKGCEYAVLVTMLERDNELYDNGIVDMSHRYPKMYVIRPQFFMTLIALLSQAARKSLSEIRGLRRELEDARSQSVDVSNFERRRDQFVAAFGKLVDAHVRKQQDAVDGIDKAIAGLEKQIENLRKVRSMFDTAEQKLIRANEMVENDFTIKKLTHGNPTMKALFEQARRDAENTPE